MTTLSLNRERISATLPAYLVDEMRDVAETENKSQSSVLEQALALWFKARLRADAKALGAMKFDDLPSEDEWLVLGSKID